MNFISKESKNETAQKKKMMPCVKNAICLFLLLSLFGCIHPRQNRMQMSSPVCPPKENNIFLLKQQALIPQKISVTFFIALPKEAPATIQQPQRCKAYVKLENISYKPIVLTVNALSLDGQSMPFFKRELVLEPLKTSQFELGYIDTLANVSTHKIVFDYLYNEKRKRKEFTVTMRSGYQVSRCQTTEVRQ